MSWGSLYYTVPVLHERIAADTGWSVQLLTLTYSLALVLAALLGPRVGVLIDQRGPRRLVAGGALLGGAGLLVVAWSPSLLVQATGMLLVGAAQAATLYPPIFAALTIWFGEERARALTIVSLFGGASSAVFAPSVAPLVRDLEWRGTLETVAIVYVAVTAPVAWFGLRVPWPVHAATGGAVGRRGLADITGTWRFRALQCSMMFAGIALYASTLNLIGLVREHGFSFGFAATVFGLVGAGQVVGRLLYLPLAHRGSPRSQTLVQVSATCVVTAALGLSASNAAPLMVAAVAAGVARGAHTLLMATGVADRWGLAGFGVLSGRFNRPIALAIAVAPFIGSALASATGSYQSSTLLLAAAAGCGLVFVRWT
jgi:MFS family permease